MPRRPQVSVEGWAALAFAVARTGVCAYRAVTQSVVHDEAFTFNAFLNGSWRTLYFEFMANNHVLFSILAKLSIRLFGLSEFTLRLVSVAAGFFLIMGIYTVLRDAEIPVALRWAAFLAIGLHPLLLDFCVVARGYSLALACLIWAIVFSMRGRVAVTGLLLGLGMAANLAVALPAGGLLAARFFLARDSISQRLRALLSATALLVLAFGLCCAGAISRMTPDQFVSAGLPTIQLSLESLIMTSIRATPRAGFFGNAGASSFLQYFIIPVVVLLVAAAGLRMLRGSDAARARCLPALALGLACLGMIAGHFLLKLNYPVDRTGLPFVVLAGIAWAVAAGEFKNGWMTGLNVVFAIILLAQFLTQFQTRMFIMWFYDRSTKQVAERIAQDTQGRPPGSVSIGATWIHQPALEFYRVYKNMTALRPVERHMEISWSGMDYYVLNAPDTQAPQTGPMEVLFSDPGAGVVLLHPRR